MQARNTRAGRDSPHVEGMRLHLHARTEEEPNEGAVVALPPERVDYGDARSRSGERARDRGLVDLGGVLT